MAEVQVKLDGSVTEIGSKASMDLRSGKAAAVGSTKRIQNLNHLFHSNRPSIDMFRCRVFTKVFKETEGLPLQMRRYKAFAEMYRTIPPVIYDDERIMGWQGKKPRCAQICIDHMAGWLNDSEMDSLADRKMDPFEITKEEQKELSEVHIPYWEQMSSLSLWKKQLDDPGRFMTSGVADMVNFVANPGSHFCPDYETLMRTGLKGRMDTARECLRNIDPSDPEDFGKKEFYEGIMEVCEAVHTMVSRYADLAESMAEKETRPERAAELREMARVSRKVPWEPAETYYEAIQMVWWIELVLLMEGCGTALGLGRLDQTLYPYYKKDLDAGRITPEGAMEYIEELYIKLTQIPWLSTAAQSKWSGGYYRFEEFAVGGVDEFGNDASNDLTYLMLRAYRHCRTTGPTIQLMISPKTPQSLMIEAIKLAAEGMGHPSFFSVNTVHEMLEYRGGGVHGKSPFSLQEIRKYGCLMGCVHPGMMGYEYGHLDSCVINLAAVVSLVLHNGVKPAEIAGYGSGERIGLETGDPRTFTTYEMFEDAVKEQMKFWVDNAHEGVLKAERIIMDNYQFPMFSVFAGNCIERGFDVTSGKGAYCNLGPDYACIGIADAGNSMAAIKKLVFDDKELTMDEVIKAIDANFEGYEDTRKKMLQAPKYGNDDDYVDLITVDLVNDFSTCVRSKKSLRGHYCDPGIQPAQANVGFGNATAALPSGRKAHEPLSDAQSATPNTDINGPLAAAKSYGKFNFPVMSSGTLLNMWISKNELVEA